MTLTELKTPAGSPADDAATPRYGYTDDRPDWVARGSVLALLIAVGVLYIWGLSTSGYANSFYSAAAQAGSENWVAWFFGSLDGGNSITVDKPPAAIWLMALSVRLFGLSSWSILVPEALLGVASVGVLYATVRRSLITWRGADATNPLSPRGAHWAALAGAAVFALTPVATLMFRFNNPDALLVFTMMLASYFTVRATEHASRGWLALAGVAIGFGFLTKMLQAFLVLPALVVAYWFAAPASWKKKLLDLVVAFITMVASFGWYVAVVELTPASLRPYIGGSQSNSLLELILSYNGLGRLTGNETGSVGGGGGNGGNWGSTGILRMFEGVSGGMVSWLIPAALALAIAAIAVALIGRTRALAAGAAAATDDPAGHTASGLSATASTKPVQTPQQALLGAAIIWLGWLAVTAAVFSFMAGIYHDYYTVALAPAIGGAVAIGGAAAWANRGHWAARVTLGATSIGTGIWALVLLMQAGGWYTALGWTAFTLGTMAGLAMIWVDQLPTKVAGAVLAVALGAGLIGPTAYSLNTAMTAHTGSIVTAGPVTGMGGGMGGPGGQPPTNGTQAGPAAGAPPQAGGPGGGTDGGGGGMSGLLNGATVSDQVLALLTANSSDYTWVAATTGSQNAASYQLAANAAVMAIGGFNGSDPSPTLAQFQADVAEGKIHYYIGGSVGQSSGGSDVASQIATWVSENYTAQTVDGVTLYDLTAK